MNIKPDEALFAMLLLNRHEPMPDHLCAAVRERLGYKTDAELREMLRTGRADQREDA